MTLQNLNIGTRIRVRSRSSMLAQFGDIGNVVGDFAPGMAIHHGITGTITGTLPGRRKICWDTAEGNPDQWFWDPAMLELADNPPQRCNRQRASSVWLRHGSATYSPAVNKIVGRLARRYHVHGF